MGKIRVVFAKCNWIGGNFKISEGWFCKYVFLILSPVKIYIYLSKSFIWNVCVEVCKKFGLSGENKGVYVIYKSTSPFVQVVEIQK
jgi:hypothetical protein